MQSQARAESQSSQPVSWDEQSPSAIIDHILERFHAPLRRELPELIRAARQVESATRGLPLSPAGLAEHLEQIHAAVESHLEKEEKILFPLIRMGRGRLAFMPIKVMMAEHDDHVANLRLMRDLAHGFELPARASAEWKALYQRLERLEDDLNQHIHLENHVLFSRAMAGEPEPRS